MYLNNKKVSNIYVGNTLAAGVYLGDEKVWPTWWNWDLNKISSIYYQRTLPWLYSYFCMFNDDWTKFYYYRIYRWETRGNICQYDVPTAWDVSNLTNLVTRQNVDSYWSFCFWNNWTLLFSRPSKTAINKYSLSSPYDISSVTYVSQVTWYTDYPWVYCFSKDWKRFFYSDNGNTNIYQYESNTARGIGTWTLKLTISSNSSLVFSNDGEYAYVSTASRYIYQYKLENPYDLTWATLINSKYLDISWNLWWMCFDTNWNNLYILVQANNLTYLYHYKLQ